jgi:hypothetical protein
MQVLVDRAPGKQADHGVRAKGDPMATIPTLSISSGSGPVRRSDELSGHRPLQTPAASHDDESRTPLPITEAAARHLLAVGWGWA